MSYLTRSVCYYSTDEPILNTSYKEAARSNVILHSKSTLRIRTARWRQTGKRYMNDFGFVFLHAFVVLIYNKKTCKLL